MALLFEPESLEWPSLTEGDSCKENKFLIIAYTTAGLAFTLLLSLNGTLL